MILEFPVSWAATLGEHTFTATVDPAGKLLHEINRTNNTRVKNVNVRELPEGEEPEIEITTHSGPARGVLWTRSALGAQRHAGIQYGYALG